MENLTKSFGDLVLFENISLGLSEGQRVGLIAKNGSGKTTLLNILSGKEGYDNGTISFRRDLRVGYLEQDPQYPEELTVLEACFHHGNSTVELIKEYERCMETEGHPGLDEILVRMDHEKAWEYEQKAKQILSQLKIRDFSQHVKYLSGGQLKRVALANTLITEPDLLILDEPTNHLDLDMTEWLEEYLRRNNLSLLMVTHDRYFLDRVCSEIVEIDNRQIYQYKGNYSYYLEKRQERIEAKTVEIERANNLYRTELEWMRRMPQARGHKARYREDAFYELEKVAKQRFNNDNVKLDVKASYIGSKIFEADHLYKSFGDLKILDDFSYIFSRYEKMGIVGNNGTGKSTFIKILMGLEQADSGTLDIGETVRFGYYSQDGLQFDEQMKVIDVVQDIAEVIELGNGKKLTASQFLQHFLFTPETQHSYVYKLSGGERRRLYLCTVLMRNPNFLVLDEPTNDLDIVTLNVLEDAADFEEFLKDTEIYWDYVDEDLVREKRAQETCLKIYLPDSDEGAKQYADIRAALENLKARDEEHAWGRLCTETALTRQEDWEWGWKQYFKPFPVGRGFMIKPSWETAEDPQGRRILEIDPASSFGTGSHDTTQLCMMALEDAVKPGDKLLDMGTGSGILAIAAAMLGADVQTIVDIDENCLKTAHENAEKNHVEIGRGLCGDALRDPKLAEDIGGGYDVIVANIVADVIIGMSPMFADKLVKGGTLICSGILNERAEEVRAALEKSGFTILSHEKSDDWSAFAAKK